MRLHSPYSSSPTDNTLTTNLPDIRADADHLNSYILYIKDTMLSRSIHLLEDAKPADGSCDYRIVVQADPGETKRILNVLRKEDGLSLRKRNWLNPFKCMFRGDKEGLEEVGSGN